MQTATESAVDLDFYRERKIFFSGWIAEEIKKLKNQQMEIESLGSRLTTKQFGDLKRIDSYIKNAERLQGNCLR